MLVDRLLHWPSINTKSAEILFININKLVIRERLSNSRRWRVILQVPNAGGWHRFSKKIDSLCLRAIYIHLLSFPRMIYHAQHPVIERWHNDGMQCRRKVGPMSTK